MILMGLLGMITGGFVLKIYRSHYDIIYFQVGARFRETTSFLAGGFLFGAMLPAWYIQIPALLITGYIAYR